MKDLYILDGTGYVYRSYFAIDNMTNEQGKSTNALFGFVRSVLRLIKDFDPKHCVAVFDGPHNIAQRQAIYADYKAHRKPTPEDLPYQLEWAQEFCSLLGISTLVIPGVEADDTIGTLARLAKDKEDTRVYLCTSDKDMLQLIDDKTFVLQTYNDNLLIDDKKVEIKYGVPPAQIADLLALTGDASDNIPGVPGFGVKTAASLLQKMGSLEQILENPDKISGKKKQAIIDHTDEARLSKQLVTLHTDVPLPDAPNLFSIQSPDTCALKTFYLDKGFFSLIKEMEGKGSIDAEVSYTLVDDKQTLDTLITLLLKQKEICFDTETTSLDPLQAKLVGIGFTFEESKAWYIPTNGKLGLETVVNTIKPLFASPHISFCAQNAKYDAQVLLNLGIEIAHIGFDTMLASYILNSHSHRHSLDYLALSVFGKVKIATEEIIGKGKKQITMAEAPIEKVCEYCCEDVDYTCRLKNHFAAKLETRKLTSLLQDIELPLLKVLLKMERRGIFLDASQLQTLSKELVLKLQDLEKQIHNLAGEEFNIKSPSQLSKILFEKLHITPPKKTKTGYSTNAEVLESLSEKHPIAKDILAFRSLEKLRSTYVDTLPEMILPTTNRIHCTFNQSVAATGRLSSQNPNLQNIPVRTSEGRKIREAFRPEKPGWSYVGADYSQIELRLLAHFSEDPKLLDAFQAGEDIHTHTASVVFDIPLDTVTKAQRQQAKAVNFGILYGQQAFGLSRELGISVDEAKIFIETYFERYAKVLSYLESCKEVVRTTGKATSIIGRERLIPEIHSKNTVLRTAAERLAVNTPLQGSAADLIKLAMLDVDKKLKESDSEGFLILQIHDELICEVPDGEVDKISNILQSCMEKVIALKVPLVVDIAVGKNWGEC